MRISFLRQPKSDHSESAKKDFDGLLRPWRLADSARGLSISFESNPDGQGSKFECVIASACFADLANEMLKADPEAAVRAFGTALQQFGLERSSKSEAA